MANDLNRTALCGRLTQDSKISYTTTGVAVTEFSIAVNRSRKQGDQWIDDPSFFAIKAFGKVGENIQPYLTKGKQVVIDGYLKQERWEYEGQKQSRVLVHAEQIQLLGGGQKESDQGYGYGV